MQVLAAITLGIALGRFYPKLGESLRPLGDAFIKLVKMMTAFVVLLTIANGIAGMNDLQKVGRVAGKAMVYFVTFSPLALIVGLIIANVVQPGAGLNIDPASLDVQAVNTYAAKAHEQSVTGFLSNIIPSTIVGAFADGDILQVLFFSVLFGIALAMVGETGKPVTCFLQALTAPIFKLVSILMKAAPIGAFGAMAFTIGKYGIGSVVNLAMLVATFYLTAFLFVFGVLGAVCRYNGFSIFSLLRYIKEELLLVLGTSSSEAALPSRTLTNFLGNAAGKRVVAGWDGQLDEGQLAVALASGPSGALAVAVQSPCLPNGDRGWAIRVQAAPLRDWCRLVGAPPSYSNRQLVSFSIATSPRNRPRSGNCWARTKSDTHLYAKKASRCCPAVHC
ncbi:cation:dicarboxylate symporter family transporter [Allomesorhizobium alhagi]|uniref:C4-dicarboxylate transporter DctA n=1 Tax=Mesorhizobium alhagi CCNWXJ12-2 TaxID=1107882 RepID=H0HXJ2_9HYPH|nr:C4-dicarboxylate transporter DctA [Mesorhizobium alhagi CCNWXJ12-2]